MSYNTVAEADASLGHLAAWAGLSVEDRQARLDGANLWLRASYRTVSGGYLPMLVPTPEALAALKDAELYATDYALEHELFRNPEAVIQGALTRRREKIDVLEEEYQYATPTVELAVGPVRLGQVDTMLHGVAVRFDAMPRRAAVFVV